MHIQSLRLLHDTFPTRNFYPFNLEIFQKTEGIEFTRPVTFFIGENGSGKSTFLEAIAVSLGFNPEGGTKNFSFTTRSSHSALHEYLRIAKGVRRPRDGFFLRAESFSNVATNIEQLDAEPSFGPPIINSYGFRSLHEQSHGESFLALMMNRFGGKGVYILTRTSNKGAVDLQDIQDKEISYRIYSSARMFSSKTPWTSLVINPFFKEGHAYKQREQSV